MTEQRSEETYGKALGTVRYVEYVYENEKMHHLLAPAKYERLHTARGSMPLQGASLTGTSIDYSATPCILRIDQYPRAYDTHTYVQAAWMGRMVLLFFFTKLPLVVLAAPPTERLRHQRLRYQH